MASIPDSLRVDFSKFGKDLVQDALGKTLSIFYDSCTLRQFIAVLVGEVQELYEAAIDVEKYRTLYYAEGVQLEGIGRIVGQDRSLNQYSDESWFKWDTSGQSFDQMPWYVTGASFDSYEAADDETFKYNILTRIIKNHTLVASVPEITQLIKLILGINVSFIKIGPNEVNLVVGSGISVGELYTLTHFYNDLRVDRTFQVPYPATLSFGDEITFIPEHALFFDRDEPFQWDSAEWAIRSNQKF